MNDFVVKLKKKGYDNMQIDKLMFILGQHAFARFYKEVVMKMNSEEKRYIETLTNEKDKEKAMDELILQKYGKSPEVIMAEYMEELIREAEIDEV
jgi:hypothetical protein